MFKLGNIVGIVFFIVTAIIAADVGDPALDFTLQKLEGGDFTLSDHKGKIIFIFWFGYD